MEKYKVYQIAFDESETIERGQFTLEEVEQQFSYNNLEIKGSEIWIDSICEFIGKSWGELSEDEKNELTSDAYICSIDELQGYEFEETIFDYGSVSIAGIIAKNDNETVYAIEDSAVVYDPRA